MLKRKSVGPADGLDWACQRFMLNLRKDFRGHKAEISAHILVKYTAKFHNLYGIGQNQILDALIRRNWLEPIGSDSYLINYDKVVT